MPGQPGECRERILRYMNRKTTDKTVSTTTISEALNLRGDAVYQVLVRMARDGQLVRAEPRLTGREAHWRLS